MNWQFVPLIVVGFFAIFYSFVISRKQEKAVPFSLKVFLKILAFLIPLLLILSFFTESPFSTTGAFSPGGYGIGILLGGIAGVLGLFILRFPSHPVPSPRITCFLGVILLFSTLLFFLPYELPNLLFGLLIALSLINFLGYSILDEEFQDDLALGQNSALILASSLILGVYRSNPSEREFVKEFWGFIPLALLSIVILSLFIVPKQRKGTGIFLIAVFYLAFTLAFSYLYLHHLPIFYVIASGTVTASVFTSLLIYLDRGFRLALVSLLLLMGLFAISFRFLQAYGLCLAGLSLLPFSSILFAHEDSFPRRGLNIFLLPISLLLVFRIFYQLFVSSPFVTLPTLYDFFPILGLITGGIIVFVLTKVEHLTSFTKILPPLLSLLIFSYLTAVFGLNTSSGIFLGTLLSSTLLLFLYLSPSGEGDRDFPAFLVSFLLFALLLTLPLSHLSVHLKRIHKLYITLGAVPIALLITFFLFPREGRRDEKG